MFVQKPWFCNHEGLAYNVADVADALQRKQIFLNKALEFWTALFLSQTN